MKLKYLFFVSILITGFIKGTSVKPKELIEVRLTKASETNKLSFYELQIKNVDTNSICILSSWYHTYDLNDTIQLAYYNRSSKTTNFRLFYSTRDALFDPMILPLSAFVIKPGTNKKITVSLSKEFTNNPVLIIEYMSLTTAQLANFKNLIKPPGWYESFDFNKLIVPLK